MEDKPLVAVVMGSDSDLPVMKTAGDMLKDLGIAYEMAISSAHRVPDLTAQFAAGARERGIEVIIAGAGMAAHLAGAIASHTTLPVIGVPLQSGDLAGVDALYATVQMPTGVPVATVAINGAKNAALLAAEILSIKYGEIKDRLDLYRQKMRADFLKKSEKLQ